MTDVAVIQVGIRGFRGQGSVTPEFQTLHDEAVAARDEAVAAEAETEADRLATATDRSAAHIAAVAAQAAQAAAELAEAAAVAGSTIYASEAAGRAAVVDGASFWVQGATANDDLLLYRRVNSGSSTLIGNFPNAAAVTALRRRVDFIEPVRTFVTTFLDPSVDEVPARLFADGAYDNYYKRQEDDTWVHVSPETIRLDQTERGGVPGTELTPEHSGRVTATNDGTIVGGRRTKDDLTQFGPAPETEFGAYTLGADGAREVWVAGEDIDPFCISGECPGDNVGLRHHGFEGVSWFHIATGEEPVYKSFSFLPGVQEGALDATVETLNLIVGTGQSTANGTGSLPVLTSICPATGKLLMFDASTPGSTPRGPRVLGNGQYPTASKEPIDKRKLELLVPAHESTEGGGGESQWTQAAYEMQKRLGNTHAVIASTVGIGSQGYTQIKIGSVPGNNMLEVIRRAWAIAKLRSLAFNVVVGWPQHEANVASTQAAYLALIVEFQQQVSDAVALITNGEVTNVLFAMNGFTNGTNYAQTHTEEALAQLQFSLSNPTKGVYASPCFVFERVSDGTHFTNVGDARDGSYFGRVIANQMLGRDALPLYTTSASIVTGEIHGTLHLPYGHGTLTSTSPIVTDPGSLGFSLVRVDNEVAVPIASASIIAPTTWVVVPTSPPSGVPLEIAHGYRGTPGNHGGPTTGARSPINDANADLDFFGHAFPNHLAAQKFTVTF